MSICEIETRPSRKRGYSRWRLRYIRELRTREEARTNAPEGTMRFYGRVTSAAILAASAEQFRITLPELTGACRVLHLCKARFVAARLMRQGLGMSTPEIGRRLGGRDPTTIRNAVMRADFLLMTDPEFSIAFEVVKARLWPQGWPQGWPQEAAAEQPSGCGSPAALCAGG